MAAPWSESRFQKSQVPILPPIQSPKQSLVATTQSRAVVPYDPSHSSNTIERLESRLNALEQAHKMLLEELVNTQSHSQTWITHHEKAGQLREKEIVSVREALGLSSSTLNQVLNQVRENERRLDVFQTKMDQLTDTMHYHDFHHSQQKLAQQVQQLQNTFHHLQEQCSHLKEESHQHKESISTGLAGLTTSLTSQGRSGAAAIRDFQEGMTILEEEQKALGSNVSRLDGAVIHLESSQVQMRKLLETRSDETWSVLNDLRAQLTAMDMHKKKQDYWLKQSFSEIHEKLSQFSHSLATSVNGVSSKIKQTEDQSKEKRAELVSQVWEELKERERQWKEERNQREEELQHQLNEIERHLKTNAQEHISQHDSVLANLEKQCTEVQEMHQKSQEQFDKSISTLTKSVSLIEKESQVTKKHLSSVLEAEIKTRREEILTLQSQYANLQESCHRSHESIQLLMDKLQTTISGNTNMVQENIAKLHNEWQEAHKRLLVDIGVRISTLHSEVHSEVSSQDRDNIKQQIHTLQEQIQVSLENTSHLQKTINTLEKNCDIISQTSDNNSAITQEIHTRTVETDNKIYQLANTIQDLQIKLLGEIRNESRQRYQEIHQVKNDLGWIQISLHKLLYPSHTPHQVTMTAPPIVYLPHTIEEVDAKPHPVSSDHENTDTLHESNEDEEETDPIELAHARPFGESPTPEPRSLHSSPSGTHKLRRSRPSRRGRNALPLSTIQIQEPSETMGTFTSAPPTPDNQRIILVNEETIDREEIRQEDERECNHLFENTSNLPATPHLLSPSLLTETRRGSNLFIKSFVDEEESNGERISWLNEWGLYQTLRLLQMKEKLMRPVYKLRERKLQEKDNS